MSERKLLPSCVIKNWRLNNADVEESPEEGVYQSIINYYFVNKVNNNVTTNNVVTHTLSTHSISRGGSLSPANLNKCINLLFSNNTVSLPSLLSHSLKEVLQS
jgi:hypothetical protein